MCRRQKRRAELGGRLQDCRVSLVIGTRPEAIKLSPLAKALASRGVGFQLVLTGQHPGLRAEDFGLGSYPAAELRCPGAEDPHVHVGRVARSLPAMLGGTELVVVQGDTSSALGGALGAALAGVAVAHVEAGLRSHDRANPWPEEDFRIAIDGLSALLFAPTDLNAANLRREAVPGQVMVTGNTGIDALLGQIRGLGPPERSSGGPPRLLVTCHRRESWGVGIEAIANCLLDIAGAGGAAITMVLHPNPRVAEPMRRLLGGSPHIELRPPCAHAELLRLMRDSDLVLSDSGGIQEEAPALGLPLLVLRERTERPEGIASGNAILVGRDSARILDTVRRLLSDESALAAMRRPCLPYGDGRASERIASAIVDWLDAGRTPQAQQLLPAA